jgi:hypothetical protein
MAIDFNLSFTDLPPVVIALVAVYILFRMVRFMISELKTSPRDTFFDKVKTFLSAIVFIFISTVAFVLIVAMVISTVAINTIYGIQETKSVFFDAMAQPWQFAELIPPLIIILLAFITVYPLIEYILLAKRTEEGPMEIQKWFERRIINRYKAPWSYFIAIFLYVAVVFGPPVILSLIARYAGLPAQLGMEEMWVYIFIFAAYIFLGPIFYLSYYSTIGSAQLFFRGALIMKTRKKWKKSKHIFTKILFFISILSLISSITNLISAFPILWGDYPTLTTSYKDVEHGFLESTIELIMQQIPSMTEVDFERYYLFVAIIPLDFVLFFITTVGFGILGFYSKFLSKETLNRPQMVLFAAYIICAIAFEVLLNILVTWPWILPNLYLDFTVPANQQIVLQFFGPAMVFEKIFVVGFLFYNMFMNKNVHLMIDRAVLNEALLEYNLDIIKTFSNNRNEEMRLLVANAIEELVYDLIATDEKDKQIGSELIGIIEGLILDKNFRVANKALNIFREILNNFEIDESESLFAKYFTASKDYERMLDKFTSIISKSSVKQVEKIKLMLPKIISGDISEYGGVILANIIQQLSVKHNTIVGDLCIPLLDSNKSNVLDSSLSLLFQFIGVFKGKFDVIYDKCAGLLKAGNLNESTSELIVKVLGGILAHDAQFIPKYIEIKKTFSNDLFGVKKQIIGTMIQAILSNPNSINTIYKIIHPYFNDKDTLVRENVAISLGILSTVVTTQKYSSLLQPDIIMLSNDAEISVKKNLLQSLIMMGNLNKQIFIQPQFQKILIDYLLKMDKETRHQIFYFFEQMDVNLILNDAEKFVQGAIDKGKVAGKKVNYDLIGDLLDFLTEIGEKIYKNIEKSKLLNFLLNLPVKNDEIDTKIIQLLAKLSESSFKIFEIARPVFDSAMKSKNGEQIAAIVALYCSLSLRELTAAETGEKIPVSGEKTKKFLHLDNIFELAVGILQMNDDHVDLAVIKFLSHYLEVVKTPNYEAVAKAAYELFDSKSSDVALSAFQVLSNIQSNTSIAWEKKVLPQFKSLVMAKKETDIEILGQALNFIGKKISDVKMVRKILIKGAKKSKNLAIRIKCFSAIAEMKEIYWDKNIVSLLMENIQSDDPKIRNAVVSSVGNIINKLMSFIETDQSNRKLKKNLERLIMGYANDKVIKDGDKTVRFNFLKQNIKILKAHPEETEILIIVKDAVQDSETNIAVKAIKSFFEYLEKNPEKASEYIHYIYDFGKCPSVTVKEENLRQIKALVKRNKNILRLVIPNILDLVVVNDMKMRGKAVKSLVQSINEDPESILEYSDLIINTIDSPDMYVRRDSFEIITAMLGNFNNLKKTEQKTNLLNHIQLLSRDNDMQIRKNLAKIFEEIYLCYVDKRVRLLGIIYNLIQSQDFEIIRLITEPLKDIVKKVKGQKKNVIKNLTKLHNQTQNPKIHQMIDDIQGKKKSYAAYTHVDGEEVPPDSSENTNKSEEKTK